MADEQPRRVTYTFEITDDIAPGDDAISLDAYLRLVAEAERTGMTIDEVLDVLIQSTLPAVESE